MKKYVSLYELYLNSKYHSALKALIEEQKLEDINKLYKLYASSEKNSQYVGQKLKALGLQAVLDAFQGYAKAADSTKDQLLCVLDKIADGTLSADDPVAREAAQKYADVHCLFSSIAKFFKKNPDECPTYQHVCGAKLQSKLDYIAAQIEEAGRAPYAYKVIKNAGYDWWKLGGGAAEEKFSATEDDQLEFLAFALEGCKFFKAFERISDMQTIRDVLMTFKPAERSILLFLCWSDVTVKDYKRKDFSKVSFEVIETLNKYGLLNDLELEFVSDKSDSYYSQHKSALKEEFCKRVKNYES